MAEKCIGWVDEQGRRRDCQFGDEPAAHVFDGKSYCCFHLPMGEAGEGGKIDWSDDQKTAISDAIIERIVVDAARPEREREELDFCGVVVPATLDLKGQTIELINFSGAQFHGYALFAEARFHRNAWFTRAQFHGFAMFAGAQFHGVAWFAEAQFHGGASFATIKNAEETDVWVFNVAVFRGAHFGSIADFSSREFRGQTDFTDAVFELAPNFHGSILHQDTAFGGIDCFRDKTSYGADRAYRTLRQAMEQHRARAEEGMFYALEQKARRHQMKRSDPAYLVSLAYELGSNYGLSIVRPVLWFVGGIFVSAFLLLVFGVFGGAGGAGADLGAKWTDAVLFSVRQTFMPFDALRAVADALLKLAFNPGGTGWLRAWGVFLTLFEALAALLLVLAVRWRYRR